MNKKYFDLARKVSLLSNHPKHKMGAILLNNGKVQSFGINQVKTHPKSNHPFKMIHCEFHAILNSKLNNFNECSIYIYRETPGGKIAPSYPCYYCKQMLQLLGIKKIYYTDYSGFKSENI